MTVWFRTAMLNLLIRKSGQTQKREERKVVYQMIDDAAVAAVSSGEKFQAFLNIQAQFDRYSASNALLIAHQCRMQRSWQTLLPGRTLVFTSRRACAINLLEPGQEYTNQDGTVKTSYKVKRCSMCRRQRPYRSMRRWYPMIKVATECAS